MDEVIKKYYEEFRELENSTVDDLNNEGEMQEVWLLMKIYAELSEKQGEMLIKYKRMYNERMSRRMERCYEQGFLKALEIQEEKSKNKI